MSGLAIYAFFGMPVIVVILGGLAAFAHERSMRRSRRTPAK